MNIEIILEKFKKVHKDIEIKWYGNQCVVLTPFMFEDGDHFTIILYKDKKGWYLTDEGHTHMRYGLNAFQLKTYLTRKDCDKQLQMFINTIEKYDKTFAVARKEYYNAFLKEVI